jgi:integrase
VSEYLTRWLVAIEPAVRPATACRYGQVIERHLTPGLGGLKLTKLGPAHLAGFYADRITAGLSPTTVNNQHMILHRALDQAVRWRLIPTNPCDAVEPPRRSRLEITTWTASQARTFLTATVDHPLGTLYRLALLTGMRRGELLALRWQDVDLERGSLAVRRTLTRDRHDKWQMGEPKTASGRRSIALPPSCGAALKRHHSTQKARKLRHRDIWQDHDLTFERGDGVAFHPNVAYETLQRLAVALALPTIRFHDLRHTAATLMLAEGVHPKIVQERLGHASITITLDLYSHVTMSMQREAADALDAALG